MMSALYEEKGSSLRIEILEDPQVSEFIDTHAEVLDSSFETTEMSDTLRKHLQESDWMFSGMKTFHELNEAFPSLLDEDGNRKPFEQFLKDVQTIDSTYNRNYLSAEYNFAQASAEMAAKWENYTEDGDEYLLQYRTAGDDKVRPEHAELNGVTLPPSDSFWDTYYPPNGWNCRCTVVQVLKDEYGQTPHDEAMQRGAKAMSNEKTAKMFAFNPGKEERTFPDYNPYTISKCANCPKALNLAAGIPGSELCAACNTLHKCSDITASLRKLQTVSGKAFADALKEMTGMKIFRPVDGMKDIYSAIGESDRDYDNLLGGAKKMSSHGYAVYILPNPTSVKSGDYILAKKNFVGLYDLKTISGESSAGNRLRESKGQANRVILNITSNYNPRRLAADIKNYFDSNSEAEEVIVIKGGRMLTTTRANVRAKKWAKRFYTDYTKKK